MWITRMINRLADTSAQIRIRLSILLVVGLGALATHLGFEAILGAFIAGAILRLVDADAEPSTRCSTRNSMPSATASSSRSSS